jgi:hypothetical protein
MDYERQLQAVGWCSLANLQLEGNNTCSEQAQQQIVALEHQLQGLHVQQTEYQQNLKKAFMRGKMGNPCSVPLAEWCLLACLQGYLPLIWRPWACFTRTQAKLHTYLLKHTYLQAISPPVTCPSLPAQQPQPPPSRPDRCSLPPRRLRPSTAPTPTCKDGQRSTMPCLINLELLYHNHTQTILHSQRKIGALAVSGVCGCVAGWFLFLWCNSALNPARVL